MPPNRTTGRAFPAPPVLAWRCSTGAGFSEKNLRLMIACDNQGGTNLKSIDRDIVIPADGTLPDRISAKHLVGRPVSSST